MSAVLDHIVLNVRDIPASVNFYTNILRFDVERLEEYEAGRVPFPSVRVNTETVIGLFPPMMWENGGIPALQESQPLLPGAGPFGMDRIARKNRRGGPGTPSRYVAQLRCARAGDLDVFLRPRR